MANNLDFIRELLAIPEREARVSVVFHRDPGKNGRELPELINELKEFVIARLRDNADQAVRGAEVVLEIGEAAGNQSFRALGHRLIAQAHLIGFGEAEKARTHYDQALSLYRKAGDELGRAETVITYIWSLALSGDYEEAIRECRWAAGVLEEAGETRSHATLLNNMGAIYNRAGNLHEAVDSLERAYRMFAGLGEAGRAYLTNNATNRALALADLGRFRDSIRASEEAEALAAEAGQGQLLARIRQNLAVTYQMLGHYNRALKLLGAAREGWEADGRRQEIHQCDLAITYCLLALRRFGEVVEKCAGIRDFFGRHEASFEVAQTFLNQAEAEAGLGMADAALESLQNGKAIFEKTGNGYWAARCDLAAAALMVNRGKYDQGAALGSSCLDTFKELGAPREEAAAWLQVGRSHLRMGDPAEAARCARMAESISVPLELPALNFQAFYLLGQAAEVQGRLADAAAGYRQGIRELERLQGRIMVEHRADFLAEEDKTRLYEAAVAIAVREGDWFSALNDIERSKSRALMDIISNRIDLRLRPQSAAEAQVVEEINDLLHRRNTLLRRSEAAGLMNRPGEEEIAAKIQELELRIEELRSRWLIDHADYSEQPGFFQPPNVARTLARLPEGTAVLAYFFMKGQSVLFLLHRTGGEIGVHFYELPAGIREVRRVYRSLTTNFAAAAFGDARHLPELNRQAHGFCRRLYDLLLAPAEDMLPRFENLVIVPHGPLHYLPFHALNDGNRYLIETHRVSYLPGISFLTQAEAADGRDGQVLCAGSSYQGRLPHAVAEARQVAALWGTEPLLEEGASLDAVRDRLAGSRLVHCASHAEFRPDRPLFSGIALSDGWLTTLDIFNLKLDASLVTLSACSTGRSVLGGGEELFGFIRALLAAGAESLLLSQWAVDDFSTARWMESFYGKLQAGEGKAAAVQAACCRFINGTAEGDEAGRLKHPYFWAPFYLVGRTGEL